MLSNLTILLKKYFSLGLRSPCKLVPVVYSESSIVYREPQPVNSGNKPNIRKYSHGPKLSILCLLSVIKSLNTSHCSKLYGINFISKLLKDYADICVNPLTYFVIISLKPCEIYLWQPQIFLNTRVFIDRAMRGLCLSLSVRLFVWVSA